LIHREKGVEKGGRVIFQRLVVEGYPQ